MKNNFRWLLPYGLEKLLQKGDKQKCHVITDIYNAFVIAFRKHKIPIREASSDILSGEVINVIDIPLSFIDVNDNKYQVTINLIKEVNNR